MLSDPPHSWHLLPPCLQVRTAELLQLHTEMRHSLFLAGGKVPSALLPRSLSLDLLKFLQLWDHEARLTQQVGKQHPPPRCCFF